jgi:virulence-associated protein VagC
MTAVTAKVFNSGRFQTIRLPKAFWVKSSTVKLVKIAGGFTVSEANPSARRLKTFLSLAGSCPDFRKIAGNTSRNIRRNWE